MPLCPGGQGAPAQRSGYDRGEHSVTSIRRLVKKFSFPKVSFHVAHPLSSNNFLLLGLDIGCILITSLGFQEDKPHALFEVSFFQLFYILVLKIGSCQFRGDDLDTKLVLEVSFVVCEVINDPNL
jgi:hypothetical protein